MEKQIFNADLIELIVSSFVDTFTVNSLIIFLVPECLLYGDFL